MTEKVDFEGGVDGHKIVDPADHANIVSVIDGSQGQCQGASGPVDQRLASEHNPGDDLAGIHVLAATGDVSRFDNPRQLMKYIGLTPSEHSSGNNRRLGGITKTGNGHVRRVLIEAAKAYRHKPKVSPAMLKRQERLPKTICEIAWKAQQRLCKRYRALSARGKHANTVTAAIAREIVAFMWAITKELQQDETLIETSNI